MTRFLPIRILPTILFFSAAVALAQTDTLTSSALVSLLIC